MKRMMTSIIALILLLSGISPYCAATENADVEYVYLEDGSYYEITMTTSRNSRIADTCYGQKRQRYYDANDVLQWTVALSVEFEYDPGVSVECVDATCDVYISDKAWRCNLSYATKSGSIASCHAEMAEIFLLIPVQTIYVDLAVHCDTYGNME